MEEYQETDQENVQQQYDGQPDIQTNIETEKRLRTLTEKAEQNYLQSVQNYNKKLTLLKRNVDYEIGTFKSEEHDIETLIVCKNRTETSVTKYLDIADEFAQYLRRTNTQDSIRELDTHRLTYTALEDSVNIVLREMRRMIDNMMETRSNKSRSSRSKSSAKSTTTSVMIRMKAKVEATKASLDFAAKEAELKKAHALVEEKAMKADAELQRQKLSIQADLEFLNVQKEAEVAHVEYKAAIEEAESQDDIRSLRDVPKLDHLERTRQFVENQRNVTIPQELEYTQDRINYPVDNESNTYNQPQPTFNVITAPQNCNTFVPRHLVHGQTHNTHEPVTTENVNDTVQQTNTDNSNNIALTELSRFLLKKDLLLSRFSRFNDRPESYALWKSSFQAITKELLVTAVEESELLIKWLGSESSKFAQSIRTSNIHNPSKGLKKIWDRLEERFGSPEMVETSLKLKLCEFPKITFKDTKKLYDLQDILSEILSTKENPKYEKLLSYFDTSMGINQVVSKLPPPLQAKWRDKASNYKRLNSVAFPPFSFFVDFISSQASTLNDPGFNFESDNNNVTSRDKVRFTQKSRVQVNKTAVSTSTQPERLSLKCVIHKTNHSLNNCRAFRSKSIGDRRKILKENGICFKCLESRDHLSRECTKTIFCQECTSSYHSTGMHFGDSSKLKTEQVHGGEPSKHTVVQANCMEICKGDFSGKSCAKILPVYISHNDNSSKRIKTYIILDEQSNRSLARKELFNAFNIVCQPEKYTLMSCSGSTTMSGRRLTGLTIESLDGSIKMQLPTVIECNEIPNNRNEIPTPDVARYHSHLQNISHKIEPIDRETDILLLVGRDLLEAHHVLEQRIGPPHTPYAQRLNLGWVVVGDVCLGPKHVTDSVKSYKTYIHAGGRPSIMKPCPNTLNVRELLSIQNKIDNFDFSDTILGNGVFDRTEFDDKPGRSVEDKIFLDIMNKEFKKDETGNWCAPLLFKPSREQLPNNFLLCLRRAKTLDRSLQSDIVKREHFLEFMQNLIDNNHAEIAPQLKERSECWYLPVFGIYHPKKPGKIRCVFDSSAKFGDISLNKVLLQGPDLNNSLLGVLMRFRKNRVAASADIQQMFYSFSVRQDHRDFLRFLWHKDNDFSKELIAFRMTVHVFGNSPSPAVATYGLRKSSELAEPDIRNFIERHFYVDDGLISVDSSQDMISLLTRTQKTLMKEGNIRLHKFISNSDEVMSALPQEDLAQDLKSLDLNSDIVPLQRSLGLYWNLSTDSFTYQISNKDKPFTRRGVLSTLNGIFDPLGFVAPVIIQGKLILRKLTSQSVDWDEPLPVQNRHEWECWRNSLCALQNLSIPRMYVSRSLS